MYGKISLHQEMGYDRSVSMFSPEGLLLQVEYAEKAVNLGSPILGMTFDKGVIIIGYRKGFKLVIKDSIKKVFEIDEGIIAGAAGVMSDARRLIEKSQVIAQEHRIQYENRIDLLSLVKEIANIKQYYTQAGGLRPFGCSIIFGAVENNKPTLYVTTPSGIYVQYLARAIGKDSDKMNKILEKEFKVNDLGKTIKLGVKIFKETIGEEFNLSCLDVAYVTESEFKRLLEEELKKYQ